MTQFFAKDFLGAPFEFLGTAHLIALLTLVILNIVLSFSRNAAEQQQTRIRWTMAIILWLNEIGWHIWNYTIGEWSIQTMIPLHVCSILVWLGGWMLVSKNFRIYEFMYFIGIGGALQALMTPDLGVYGFPHYRFFQTFISHGLMVTSAIYMTVAEGFRPTWKSMFRVLIGTNIYLVFVFIVNIIIGSNYMFINHKPPTASILDLLPDWPVYLLYMEAMGLVTFLILYLPFIIKDAYNKFLEKRDGSTRLDNVTRL
ncbi:MAG: TIGR02206 family membrane protein [Anaerolineales bacterium]|nr:TIGR02206 family membrane protein [Anaerolineales bacterium]